MLIYTWFTFKHISILLWYNFLNIFYDIRFNYYKIFTNKFSGGITNPTDKKNWVLTFEDNFNESEINWSKWNKWWSEDYSSNSSLSPAISSIDCISVENSILKLTTLKNDNPLTKDEFPLKTGRLNSMYDTSCDDGEMINKGFEQQYGYYEIKCKPPKNGKMFWPAFWLWGNDWPPEIDIFEFMGAGDVGTNKTKEISFTCHWGDNNNFYHGFLGKNFKGIDWSLGYHTYACKWEWNYIKFYIDNIAVWICPFNSPSNKMSINITNGGHWDNLPSDEDLPGIFYVDYVRAYKHL